MSNRNTRRILADGTCGDCGRALVGISVEESTKTTGGAYVRCAKCGHISNLLEFRPVPRGGGE